MMPTPPSNDFRLSEPPPETRRAFVRKPLESSGQPVAVELDVYVQAEAHRVTRVQRARLLLDGDRYRNRQWRFDRSSLQRTLAGRLRSGNCVFAHFTPPVRRRKTRAA
jgi:hypothetical protein